MHLTFSELSAASSIVAALAIIGGYLGVRSANQNALEIAREERSNRNKEESNQLKRDIYARFGAVAMQYRLSIGNEDKQREFIHQAADAMSLIYLVAHGKVVSMSAQLLDKMGNEADVNQIMSGIGKVMAFMKADLEEREAPSEEDLDQALENLHGGSESPSAE